VKLSVGIVPPEVSVIYRLILASSILLLWCFYKKLPMKYSISQDLFILLFGILLYGVNLTLLYTGSAYITSGIVAIVFSAMVVMNIINGRIFLGNQPSTKAIFGASAGMIGLAVIFFEDLLKLNLQSSSLVGLSIILCATIAASLGSMTSIRNQRDNTPVTPGNAIAMAYGAAFLIIYAFFNGSTFAFYTSVTYISSLAYLSFFGAVLAFSFYLKLLSIIGADKAGYVNLLFPIIALIISILAN